MGTMSCNLQRIAQDIERIVRITQFIQRYRDTITSAIRYIMKLAIEESEIQQFRREFMRELEKAKISADSFIDSAREFFTCAHLNSDQETKITEYYKNGNYEEIKEYITQVKEYFTAVHKSHTEFIDKFNAVTPSCESILRKCDDKKKGISTKVEVQL